jgi:DNA-binding GntR family transcriptional regulator
MRLSTSDERRPFTKQQFVYETLRASIVRCELGPGERLVIDELARRLQVSIVPVREALRLLESEGLVISVAHVGATVAPISRESIAEVFTVLEGLEAVSTRAVARRAQATDFTALDRLAVDMDRALAEGRPNEWAELNTRFHLAIGRLCGMPMLEQMLQRALDHWERVRRHFFNGVLSHRASEAQREHHQLLSQMKAGDLAGLERTIRDHNQGALAAYAAYLDASEVDHPGQSNSAADAT